MSRAELTTMMPTHVLTGTLYPATLEPYAYLPFELPEGTTRLSLSFAHDEGNVIDLGVLDPRIEGQSYPAIQGFRGWSGGARDHFFISETEATPGYLVGDLPPGRWFVLLGLYQVQPQGCTYRIEIMCETGLQEGARQKEPVKPTPRHTGAGWYRGDLHTHTYHSDAKGSLEDLVRAAEARGLEYLAVTDHNTVSHHRELGRLETPLLLVPGQEVTTSRGHANVWGETGWLDFRVTDSTEVAKLVERVHKSGGLFSVNHPKDTGHNWHYPVPEHLDALEVWQSAWVYRNWESVALADKLLRQGRRFTFVGGSDRHQPGWPDTDPLFLQVGTPTTWLYLKECTVAGVLAAIRDGRSCISESPVGPRLEFDVAGVPVGGPLPGTSMSPVRTTITGAVGSTLQYLSDEGVIRRVEISNDAFTDSWVWQPENHFLRAEVVAASEAEETRLELAAAGVTLSEAQLEKVLARPRVRVLSSPVFVDNQQSLGLNT